MNSPDCFLASTDSYELAEPRRCTWIKRLRSGHRDDLLLMRIDPPLLGQSHGLGARDIDTVIIAPRHQGVSLFPIERWPVYVHVARILIEHPEQRDQLQDREFESLAWAELYANEQAAREALRP